MKKTSFFIAAIVSSTLFLSMAPALALGNNKPVPANTESSSVTALKIGKVGNFGDCTGTLVADQQVLTAHHCLESVNSEETQTRIGGKIYNADSQTLFLMSDAGLLHLTEEVTDTTPAKVSRDILVPGQAGTLYSWSSSSSMAQSGQLPVTKMVVSELLGGGPTEGAPGRAAPGAAQTKPIPAGTESIPADVAMMPMVQSAILDAHSISDAGMQGGDSGGPFFVDGKLAGLATAGTSNGDPDLPSPSVAITTLADTADWIDDIASGCDTESVLTVGNTPALPKTTQTSGDHAWAYLAIACAGVIIAAARSCVRNG